MKGYRRCYANLIGYYTDISNAKINDVPTLTFLEENLNHLFKLDCLRIEYKNELYYVHSSMIQVLDY